MAPMSSAMASVSRKIFRSWGTPLTMPSTPSENAMSVAMGTPQPRRPSRPTVLAFMPNVEGHIEKCGNNHSAEGAENRQRGPAHVGELTMHDLVLDLHADQEKEDGHQGIVDPGVYGQAQPGEG